MVFRPLGRVTKVVTLDLAWRPDDPNRAGRRGPRSGRSRCT
ncbi:hypothetical protein [Nonomuraea sp. bgisy101]